MVAAQALHVVVAAGADQQTKSANGALGLVVFLFLAAAVAVLLRSMNKHLRKAQRMKIEEDQQNNSKPIEPTT
jgi:hypothetical protein